MLDQHCWWDVGPVLCTRRVNIDSKPCHFLPASWRGESLLPGNRLPPSEINTRSIAHSARGHSHNSRGPCHWTKGLEEHRSSRSPAPTTVSSLNPLVRRYLSSSQQQTDRKLSAVEPRGHPPPDGGDRRRRAGGGAGGGVDGLPETPPTAPAQRRGGARAAGGRRRGRFRTTCAAGRRTARRPAPDRSVPSPLHLAPPGGGGGVVRAREPSACPRGSGRSKMPAGRAAGG